jgi:hypothetical protein
MEDPAPKFAAQQNPKDNSQSPSLKSHHSAIGAPLPLSPVTFFQTESCPGRLTGPPQHNTLQSPWRTAHHHHHNTGKWEEPVPAATVGDGAGDRR